MGGSGPVCRPGARRLREPDGLGERPNLGRSGDVQHDGSAHVADDAVRRLWLAAAAQGEVTVFLHTDGAAHRPFELCINGLLGVAFRGLVATAGGQAAGPRPCRSASAR